MVIGRRELKRRIEGWNLVENCDYPNAVNPASVNLRLGRSFATMKHYNGIISLGDVIEYDHFEDRDSYIIRPGEFVLATTMEKINLPEELAAFVQGRSSIGRIALNTQNAGYIDPGFSGEITLELKNDSPYCIKLLAGYPVAQLVVVDAFDVDEGYSGKYVGQTGATGTRMYLDDFVRVVRR